MKAKIQGRIPPPSAISSLESRRITLDVSPSPTPRPSRSLPHLAPASPAPTATNWPRCTSKLAKAWLYFGTPSCLLKQRLTRHQREQALRGASGLVTVPDCLDIHRRPRLCISPCRSPAAPQARSRYPSPALSRPPAGEPAIVTQHQLANALTGSWSVCGRVLTAVQEPGWRDKAS
jgi:hypothetical protein